MTVFVLFSQQRSGTSALTSFIAKHANIINLHEILNPYNVDQEDNFFGYWLANDPAQMLMYGKSPSDLFSDFVASRQAKYANSNILFDIKLNNVHHVLNYWEELPGFSEARLPWLIAYFQRQRTPIIYLHRDNHFKRFVSAKIAELTGIYRSDKPNLSVSARLEINVDELNDYIFRSEMAHQAFVGYMRKFDRVLSLSYEDVFMGSRIRSSCKVQLGEFLGFQAQLDSEPHYMKQNPAKIEKVLKNFEEVCQGLRSVGREHYIES